MNIIEAVKHLRDNLNSKITWNDQAIKPIGFLVLNDRDELVSAGGRIAQLMPSDFTRDWKVVEEEKDSVSFREIAVGEKCKIPSTKRIYLRVHEQQFNCIDMNNGDIRYLLDSESVIPIDTP